MIDFSSCDWTPGVPRCTVVYMTDEEKQYRRPRVPEDVAQTIDKVRGYMPLEHWLLTEAILPALPYFRAEPDDEAAEPGLFRVLDADGEYIGVGLTKRQAEAHVALLDLCSRGDTIMGELEDALEDDPQHDEAYELMMRMNELTDTLYQRYMPATED